ncbi:unnamed protein product [Vitrella brassicaformis CCMP3155]|uniref:Uncharacterized protein n=1 Tax=Vitrella brassicaformis (strain CCMP3155) TaxID=1169540 RepID=A0A0G4GIV6_VITBC|nr:unnamed protein product [Vitrella brassicaformis CCMP3155]|eukprot:CEM29657.1 unnamed protein product [Vitrella brassicaformis CCMP3155]
MEPLPGTPTPMGAPSRPPNFPHQQQHEGDASNIHRRHSSAICQDPTIEASPVASPEAQGRPSAVRYHHQYQQYQVGPSAAPGAGPQSKAASVAAVGAAGGGVPSAMSLAPPPVVYFFPTNGQQTGSSSPGTPSVSPGGRVLLSPVSEKSPWEIMQEAELAVRVVSRQQHQQQQQQQQPAGVIQQQQSHPHPSGPVSLSHLASNRAFSVPPVLLHHSDSHHDATPTRHSAFPNT